MVKSDSLKKKHKSAYGEDSTVLHLKSSLMKPKKMGSEIDEIFSMKKRKKPEKVAIIAKQNISGKLAEGSKSKALETRLQSESTARSRKKTADGVTIYTEEELGLGKQDAGGTSLCPFDCDCCF